MLKVPSFIDPIATVLGRPTRIAEEAKAANRPLALKLASLLDFECEDHSRKETPMEAGARIHEQFFGSLERRLTLASPDVVDELLCSSPVGRSQSVEVMHTKSCSQLHFEQQSRILESVPITFEQASERIEGERVIGYIDRAINELVQSVMGATRTFEELDEAYHQLWKEALPEVAGFYIASAARHGRETDEWVRYFDPIMGWAGAWHRNDDHPANESIRDKSPDRRLQMMPLKTARVLQDKICWLRPATVEEILGEC